MRTDKEIQEELDAAVAVYRTNSGTWNMFQIAENNVKVKALQKELNDYYTAGAINHDMLSPFIVGGIYGQKRGNGLYEVGCSIKSMRLNEVFIEGLYSRGETIAEAVGKWNNKQFDKVGN